MSGDYRTALEQFVDYSSGVGTWKAMPPAAQDTLCRRIPAIALNFATTTGERTPLRAAATLRVPTLLLHGSRTPPIPRRITARLTWPPPTATPRENEGSGVTPQT